MPDPDYRGLMLGFAENTERDPVSGRMHHAMKPPNYCELYEDLWGPIRHDVSRVLEFGVWRGRSLAMLEAFFPSALIVGVDIRKWCSAYEQGRVRVRIGNQRNPDTLNHLCAEFGDFDIIIDDGSHHWEDQRATFAFFRDRPWRYYAIEDLHTSYVPHDWAYDPDDLEPEPFTITINKLIDRMHCSQLKNKWPESEHGEDDIRRAHITPGLCVFERQQAKDG